MRISWLVPSLIPYADPGRDAKQLSLPNGLSLLSVLSEYKADTNLAFLPHLLLPWKHAEDKVRVDVCLDPMVQPAMAPGGGVEQPQPRWQQARCGLWRGTATCRVEAVSQQEGCAAAEHGNSFKQGRALVLSSFKTSLKGLEPCLKVYFWVYCLHGNWNMHPWEFTLSCDFVLLVLFSKS